MLFLLLMLYFLLSNTLYSLLYLIQEQYSPMPVGEQIALLYCGINALMKDIRIDQVKEFQGLFLDSMRASHQDVLDTLASGKIGEEETSAIEREAALVVASLK